ncbi:DUF1871 family protein [Paenibacillus antarcticus]|uniref:DUF1871 domain-containing protein n=1 Tax=Paenibacillus antarcticus TaxID=253703 RepID=A0A168KJC5_9BACL|nr:DUF1871 family protein [Paenibacillus antarcticus]OAB42097.1 hypothetical protein PBAT_20455 [Paenibacillus antarcticus]
MSIIQIITTWDPQNLMTHAPDDEYDYEAKRIENCMIFVESEEDLSERIKQVFFEQFGDDFTKSLEECLKIAKQIIVSDFIINVKVNNKKIYLIEGRKYKFKFNDPEISFNNMIAEVMHIHWIDEDNGENLFYIYVREQKEDYLISVDELLEINNAF